MSDHSPSPDIATRVAQLEQRLARVEAVIGTCESDLPRDPPGEPTVPTNGGVAEEIEFELGQAWFARVGIAALAVGGGFMLTLPYPRLPPVVPTACGVTAAVIAFGGAHFGRHKFALISSYLRGAAMALLYCATLRLCFFSEQPLLATTSPSARGALFAASVINLSIAWRRGSPRLMGLAFLTACATPLAIGDWRVVLAGTLGLSVLGAALGTIPKWRLMLPVAILCTAATYFVWAMGNPLIGGPYHWATPPLEGSLVLLLGLTLFGVATVWGETDRADDNAGVVAALFSGVFGYAALVVHAVAINSSRLAVVNLLTSVIFLWLAAGAWQCRRSQIITFLYAMAGYVALSAAIAGIATVPNVFVWLSLESLIVVVTAIWFQSRFIILANFLIYVGIVLAYTVLSERETGISIGFGVVALASARILNWQQRRLALKTELMRNAYLASAFVVFPYALTHLVPGRFVSLSWTALALVYYGLNSAIRNQKYRWMGHATLVLNLVYLAVPSHAGLTSGYRIASFLALGSIFVGVSLLFTQSRRPAKRSDQRDAVAEPSDSVRSR